MGILVLPRMVTSVIIDNMSSPDEWVEKFIVECYADAALTQLVDNQSTDVVWNGTYSIQRDAMVFRGLNLGDTYYFRAGVVSMYTERVVYTAVRPVVAGDSSAATGISYTPAVATTAGGINVTVTPSNLPSDLDHYEAYWAPSPATAPQSSNGCRWDGNIGADHKFTFFVGGGAGSRFDVYLRAYRTNGSATAWVFLGTFGVGTLDDVADGPTFGRIRIGSSTNGFIDPRKSGVIKLGSTNPAWLQSGIIQYVKGTIDSSSFGAYIQLFWTGISVLRADNTMTNVPDLASPGITVSQLSFNIQYGFLARVSEFLLNSPVTGNPVDFVNGAWTWAQKQAAGFTSTGATGTNGIAFVPGGISRFDYQQQALQDYQPLSDGPIYITTIATPTSGTGSGSGGGNDTCPRVGMKVFVKGRGVVGVETVKRGEFIWTPDGWRRVISTKLIMCDEFIRLTMMDGEYVDQDPHTPMRVNDGADNKLLHEIGLGDLIWRYNGRNPRISDIRLIKKPKGHDDGTWVKVALQIEDPHWYLCGAHAPTIVVHNIVQIPRGC